MTTHLSDLASEAFCYLTTIGRVSGRPHTIEIWFALNSQTLYMLSGGRDKSDWVKNASIQPEITVKIKDSLFNGKARVVNDPTEDALARQLIADKYQKSEADLDEWLQSALPVAVDLII